MVAIASVWVMAGIAAAVAVAGGGAVAVAVSKSKGKSSVRVKVDSFGRRRYYKRDSSGHEHEIPPPDTDYERNPYDTDKFYFDEKGIRHGPLLGRQVGGYDYAPGQAPVAAGVLGRTPQSSTGLPIGGANRPFKSASGTYGQGSCFCDEANCCYSQDVYGKTGGPSPLTRCEPILFGDPVAACEDAWYEFQGAAFSHYTRSYQAQRLQYARMARRLS